MESPRHSLCFLPGYAEANTYASNMCFNEHRQPPDKNTRMASVPKDPKEQKKSETSIV